MSDACEENPMSATPLLFSPMTIRGLELKNRIVVPPMHQYSAIKGFPTDWHLMNAGKFAAGGAGLVVVESTKVERRGCGTVGDLGIWDDKFVEPLSRLVTFIKQQNSTPGIQLGHSGRKARATRPWEGDRPLQRTPDIDDWDEWTPVAPSAIAHSEKWPVPRALERGEVKDLVQAWGNAARMKRALRCWSCTAPTAISCTNSCRSDRTSARTNMAAPN
jgi:2,4-dienoyl-CoA reductase-like NADH-dependent reductase (Old Yellow Enzyme family)